MFHPLVARSALQPDRKVVRKRRRADVLDLTELSVPFEEDKHPRDHGKFAEKPGGKDGPEGGDAEGGGAGERVPVRHRFPADEQPRVGAVADFVKRAAEATPAVDEQTEADLHGYHRADYNRINRSIRSADTESPHYATGKRINDAIKQSAPLKEPIVVYRGVSLEDHGTATGGAFIKAMLDSRPGDEIEMLGITSTSHNSAVSAFTFTGEDEDGIMLELSVRHGLDMTKAMAGVRGFNDREMEFLLAHGSRFRVVKHLEVGYAYPPPSTKQKKFRTVQLEQIA